MRMGRVRIEDAEARLRRALEAHAAIHGIDIVVETWRTRPWASATFTGSRHVVALALKEADAARCWLAALPEADLPVRGHLVADLAVGGARCANGVVFATLTVLTLVGK